MTEWGADEAHIELPTESKCPACGSDPDEESTRLSHLSDMGYLHQDVRFSCSECEATWSCGVPVDGSDEEPDFPGRGGSLWCDSCNDSWMLIHRVRPNSDGGQVLLDLKCPREECNYFTRARRVTGSEGFALVGYPQITGKIDGSTPFGYPAEE